MSLAAGVAAAIVLLLALVVVLEPASTPPAYAAILHEAAVQTGAQKSARMDLTGAIGLSLHGQNVTTPLSGTGATQFPDRGELTEVATIFGTPLRQDIVSVGDSVWTRVNGGQWAYVPIPPDHASPIDQALAYPAQALDDLSRVGSGYRSLGNTTLSDGTRVRQIRLVIPGGAFHAFGYLSEQVSQWSVSVDVTQSSHVLRQLTISGRGVVSVLGIRVPFTYDLRLALSHFGVRVSIHSPAGAPSPRPGGTVSPATTPSGRTASSTVAARSTPTPSASTHTSPTPKPSSSSPSPCPSGTHSAARLAAKPTPAPTCASAR